MVANRLPYIENQYQKSPTKMNRILGSKHHLCCHFLVFIHVNKRERFSIILGTIIISICMAAAFTPNGVLLLLCKKKTWNWIRSIVHRSGGYWNDTGGDLFASIIVCLFDELAPISGLAVAMLSANSWFLKEQVIIYHTWYYLDLETVPNGM